MFGWLKGLRTHFMCPHKDIDAIASTVRGYSQQLQQLKRLRQAKQQEILLLERIIEENEASLQELSLR